MNTDKGSRKDLAKDWLWPIVFISSLASVITGAIDSITKLLNLAEANFYALITASTISAVLVVIMAPLEKLSQIFSVPKYRIAICVFIILVGTSAISYRLFDKYIQGIGPVNPYKTETGMLNHFSPFTSALAANSGEFDIIYLGIDGRMSNYLERKSHLFGHGILVRTFSADLDVLATRRKSKCIGINGNQPVTLMVQLLRDRLMNNGQSGMLKYIESEDDLWRLINQQKARFKQIMFTPMEINQLLKASDSRIDTVMEFVRTCIGQLNPIIRANLRNTTNSSIYITSVIYDVLDIDRVSGGAGGLEYPENVFIHKISWEKGQQIITFPSPIKIPPREDYTIALKLIPKIPYGSDPTGLAWYMRIGFEESLGNRKFSQPFQLIMSKENF